MNVQKNFFTWSEFVATNTGLPNNPATPSQLANLTILWSYLNSLRRELGFPIFVNSAFRSPAVNKKVGGSSTSYHMEGLAADIRTLPHKMLELRNILLSHEGFLKEFIDHVTYFHIAIPKR